MFGIEDFSKPLIDYSNFDFSQLKDVLVFGGSVVLIGMATIFAVLTILWAFLAVFKLVFKNADKKESKKAAKATAGNVEKAEDNTNADQNEIIAVIAAAIAMAESENSDLKFRVVSFKRV